MADPKNSQNEIALGSIDQAISQCDIAIGRHRSEGLWIFFTMLAVIIAVGVGSLLFITRNNAFIESELSKTNNYMASDVENTLHDTLDSVAIKAYDSFRTNASTTKASTGAQSDDLGYPTNALANVNSVIEKIFADNKQFIRDTYRPPFFVALPYFVVSVFIIFFSIGVSFYRFHLNEISKLEHYKLGFMRIRVAANNEPVPGFQTEVRRALTDQAFTEKNPPRSLFKSGHIDSPLPGHPTSDLTTAILNKIIDKVEINIKQ